MNRLSTSGTEPSSSPSYTLRNVDRFIGGNTKPKEHELRDQYSSPTLADNLAEVLLVLSKSGKRGVYYMAGRTCLNRFDFAKEIAEVFELDGSLVKPVTSDVLRQVAERPKRCCLDVSKQSCSL